jgi:acetyl esterase/lipase
MRKSFILYISSIFIGMMSQAQTIVPLYTSIPNSIPGPNEEAVQIRGSIKIVSKVSIPTLTAYIPVQGTNTGAAVIICPGGGYGILASSHEGEDVALALNKAGIAAFVLKYRLPNDKIMVDKKIGPLQDVQQAFKLVRSRAKEWNLDVNKIGVMGFSAGGHLAASAAAHYNQAVIDNPESINIRPDFQILLYPVISFTDSLTHLGSRTNLIGNAPAPEQIKFYSNELQVTKQSPPAFIVHAQDDRTVKAENSIQFYLALMKNAVPGQLIIYPKGGHGFGMNNPTTTDRWMEQCLNWMRSNTWIN